MIHVLHTEHYDTSDSASLFPFGEYFRHQCPEGYVKTHIATSHAFAGLVGRTYAKAVHRAHNEPIPCTCRDRTTAPPKRGMFLYARHRAPFGRYECTVVVCRSVPGDPLFRQSTLRTKPCERDIPCLTFRFRQRNLK